MKKETKQIILFIIFSLLFCFADNVFSQEQRKWFVPTGNDAAIFGVQLIAGASDGMREQILYHPDAMLRQHPNWNPKWWDSRLSQHNKEHIWVAFSDANHTFRSIVQASDLICIGIPLFEKHKYKRKQLILVALRKIVTGYIARKAGFYLTYNLHFKNS